MPDALPAASPPSGFLRCSCRASRDPGCAHHGDRVWPTLADRSRALTARLRAQAPTQPDPWITPEAIEAAVARARGEEPPEPAVDPLHAELARRCAELAKDAWIPPLDYLRSIGRLGQRPTESSNVPAWERNAATAHRAGWDLMVAHFLDMLTDERRWT